MPTLSTRVQTLASHILVLERAMRCLRRLLRARVLRPDGGKIILAAFTLRPPATDSVRGLIEAHGQSLDITAYPAMVEVLAQGTTLRLLDTELPFPLRLLFNSILGGRAALVAPVRIGGQTFGLLGLVWSVAREGFEDHEVELVEGIADQIGTAPKRSTICEVMLLRSALHERYGRTHHRTTPAFAAIELAPRRRTRKPPPHSRRI